MQLPLLKEAKVFGKRVFLRADMDVPLKSQISNLKTQNHSSNLKSQMVIEDDTRLLSWMQTLKFLLDKGAKIIIAGHLGRPQPNQESGIRNQELSLRPVAQWLAKRFHNSSFMIHDSRLGEFAGWRINESIFLLENLRFYKGEEDNPSTSSGQVFAKKLAILADIYVNDSFAASHRAHASIVGVPKYLPHFAGLRLQKEVEVLSGVLENPKRPLAVVIGGAKMETKLPLVEKMHRFANYVLIGGKIAKEVETLLKIKNKHSEEKHAVLVIGELNKDKTDILDKSVKEFLEIIKNAGTVVWNGPVGLISSKFPAKRDLAPRDKSQISNKDSEYGTLKLAEGIVKSKAYAVVGGGDTVEFLRRIKLIDKFSFVSTGGGAMLAFLSGEKLPGLAALAKT